jgi:glycosyltransferase involved in cell wall biosynthesis
MTRVQPAIRPGSNAMLQLTVSMPAYNAAKYIGQAMESVLRQEGADLELIVVDDASTDDTAEVVASCQDARVRLLRNGQRMGIGYCHNVVMRESRAPLIAHVDADDFLMPGALRAMVEALERDPTVGQAHCYFFDVDEQGKTTREAFYQRWVEFRRKRPAELDYKAKLLEGVNVINHLRTYRKKALEEVGGFNDKIRFGVDYDMGLRLIDRYAIKIVPRFLYCRRIHGTSTTESLRFKTLRFWAQLYRIRRALVRRNQVRFLKHAHFGLLRLICALMADALDRMRRRRREISERAGVFLKWRLAAPLSATLYRSAVNRLSWWPLDWFGARPGRRSAGEKRTAYYLWSFPILSETFIQREVMELIRFGVPVTVLAHEAQGEKYFEEDARRLMETTLYMKPVEEEKVPQYVRRFLLRRPLTVMNLFLHVLFCRYDARKSFGRDMEVFRRAVCLANKLEEIRAGRVHAPWASLDAFVAQLAAKLLNIPYTVQARAYDVHRNSSVVGFPAKLANAEFVITNSEFNREIIRARMHGRSNGKVRRIYNGIDLNRFQPANGRKPGGSVRILSVAELVEAKGLEYLMAACRILRDRGHGITCEIVGSRVSYNMNYYLKLQRLQRELKLEKEVSFLGAQRFDRVLEKYREADIFVLPSVIAADGSGDVTPNVVIEAMAMKLPVVSTRSRGIPELVEDGVTGILVPPRDEEALAGAILHLAQDDALRAEFGSNGRKRAEERFDIHKNIREFVELFRGNA